MRAVAASIMLAIITTSLLVVAAVLVTGCATPPPGSGMSGPMVNIDTVHVEQKQETKSAPAAPPIEPADGDPARPGIRKLDPKDGPPRDCGLPCKAS